MVDTYFIDTTLPVRYEIKNSLDIFDINNLNLLTSDSADQSNRRIIVLDINLNKHYGDRIINYFNHQKINYKIVLLEPGEFAKSMDNLIFLLEEIENFNLNRKSEPIIAIGGGTVLDIAGMAASMYRRGVPYIRVPTTFLGIIDVSVAAKTGINFKNRRNRLGSYYPPIICLLDKNFINTQDDIEISSGLGEVLKMAVIKDANLFNIIEKHGKELLESKFNHPAANEVINFSIKGMIEELKNNLWEKNLKRLVDFGHSFSPTIEMRTVGTDKELTHGQAVTIDVIFSSIISYNRNLLSLDELNRIYKTAKDMLLPVYHDYFCNHAYLIESLHDTMKHRNGDQNLPIPLKIGVGSFINDLKDDEIYKAIEVFEKMP